MIESKSEHDANVQMSESYRTFYSKPIPKYVRMGDSIWLDMLLALCAGFILSLPFLLWIVSWSK
jgi:Sec-independent protein secretion pathway component TatC